LPARHVDTGMGFERIVSVLQGVDSNYKTDLLAPLLDVVQELSAQSDAQRAADITPYRVIADHARAATFLIADGVVPGNTGRNYVCRMIVRRAARFGGKLGLHEPFLAPIAEKVIEIYGDFYPELIRNRKTILANLTQEEERFQRTLEGGVTKLETLLARLKTARQTTLPGDQAFELYATYGLPLELTRDVAREQDLTVDEDGFRAAMDAHRLASGAGETFGELGGEDAPFYRALLIELQHSGKLPEEGVAYNPYQWLETEGEVLAIVAQGKVLSQAHPGEKVEILLPETGFYVASGGQVADTGAIVSANEPRWEIRVDDMRKPAAGSIVHIGEVVSGLPRAGDRAIARVDAARRKDIMRNHTATHLLHHELQVVLGEHARQAGSLVAPDRLRFDFTHPQALTAEQLETIEAGVNREILGNYSLKIALKPLQTAIAEGAMALFGEKYGEVVRNITIGEPEVFSNELCGGTHVDETGDIGLFLITSEGSAAAGIRRIEAVTGRAAYELVQHRFQVLRQASESLGTSPEQIPEKIDSLLEDLHRTRKQATSLRQKLAAAEFAERMENAQTVHGVTVLTATLDDADADTLRQMVDRFRQRFPSASVAVLASVQDGRPNLIAAVSDDLARRGLNASELVKFVAKPLGGGGGGRPTLAQAGGKDASQLEQALASVSSWLGEHLR